MLKHLADRSALLLLLPLMLILSGCGRNLMDHLTTPTGFISILAIVIAIVALFDLLGSSRNPGNKIIWALVIIFMPLFGAILYFIFGR